mmetsp:Transcript_40030/g.78913  ORF Transcript_40030/g.78913 Transcript_40030/m.78913 type:complete len:121 (-) Transcript_40030:957-1319(-)
MPFNLFGTWASVGYQISLKVLNPSPLLHMRAIRISEHRGQWGDPVNPSPVIWSAMATGICRPLLRGLLCLRVPIAFSFNRPVVLSFPLPLPLPPQLDRLQGPLLPLLPLFRLHFLKCRKT